MRGSAFVIQRGLPETRPNFYGRESEEPPPEMAVIDDLYQLRLHGKAGFFKGVNKLTLTGSIPTRWAIRAEVTRQEFHKLMTEYYQACKLAGVVPNPNGYYYDGRVLATPFTHNIAQPGFFKTGGQIPEPIVRLAGLVEGDTLDYCYENDLLVVESVNGIGDFAYVRSLAPQVPLLKKRQPRFMWPLERFGHPHVQIMSLRGPLYGGANFYIIGDGRTGKTTMELLVLDALANIAERMPWLNVSMVIAFIGDREIDEEAYEDLLAAHPKAHMELYTAPWGLSNPDIYVEMSLFSLSRAIRLMSMGRNVVMAWDSLARVLNYHSSSTYAQQQDEDGKEKDDGFISTGLKRSSLIEFLPRLNGFYGWIDESMSFTQLATILANSKSGAASAEAIIHTQAADAATSGYLRLIFTPHAPRPWVDVSETHARALVTPWRNYDPRPAAHAWEMELVDQVMSFGDRESGDRLLVLQKWVEKNHRFSTLPEYPPELNQLESRIAKMANAHGVGPETIQATAAWLYFRLESLPAVGIINNGQLQQISPPAMEGPRYQRYLREEYLDPDTNAQVWNMAADQGLDPHFIIYNLVNWFVEMLERMPQKASFGKIVMRKENTGKPGYEDYNIFARK